MKTGRYTEAMAAYTRLAGAAARQLPRLPDGSASRTSNAGDNRRALENYRRAIEIAPDALAYHEHGHHRAHDDRQFRDAATAFEEATGWGRATR